jgi:hypothetical protein
VQQVAHPEVGSAGPQLQERIRTLDVGPRRWQRPYLSSTGLPEEHPVLPPGVGVPDQLVFLPAQRVERVGDLESSRSVGTGCS